MSYPARVEGLVNMDIDFSLYILSLSYLFFFFFLVSTLQQHFYTPFSPFYHPSFWSFFILSFSFIFLFRIFSPPLFLPTYFTLSVSVFLSLCLSTSSYQSTFSSSFLSFSLSTFLTFPMIYHVLTTFRSLFLIKNVCSIQCYIFPLTIFRWSHIHIKW